MQIEYCASCQKRIGDADFAEAKAFRVHGAPYCRTCKEKLTEPLQNETKSVAPRCSSASARLTVKGGVTSAPAPSYSADDPRQPPGNGGGSHDMKLYWCETCGRRLTHEDLATGEARDKQVKGIYCKACAPGIATQQFNAIKSPLLQATPSDTAASAAQEAGKDSAANLPVAECEISKTSVPPAETSRLSTKLKVLLIVGIASLAVLILALVLSGSRNRADQEARAAAEKQNADEAARLAKEKRKIEEARQKNEAPHFDEERRQADEKRKAEEAKLEEEQRKLEEARLAAAAEKKTEIGKPETPTAQTEPVGVSPNTTLPKADETTATQTVSNTQAAKAQQLSRAVLKETGPINVPASTIEETGISFNSAIVKAMRTAMAKSQAAKTAIAFIGPGLPQKDLDLKVADGWTMVLNNKDLSGAGGKPRNLLAVLPDYLFKEKPEMVVLFGDLAPGRKITNTEYCDWLALARLCLRFGAVPVLAVPPQGNEKDEKDLRELMLQAAAKAGCPAMDLKLIAQVPRHIARLSGYIEKYVFGREPPAGTLSSQGNPDITE